MSKCECADERAEQGASLLAEMRKVFRKHKSLTEHEVMRSITEGEGKASSMTTKKHHKKFLVAMRLWDTPVLIPNTKVKT